MRAQEPADRAPARGDTARRRALRSIAAFEAVKGLTAIAATLGLLSLLHHDLHHIAVALIGHIGLDPGAHYPALLIHDLDALRAAKLRPLLLAAACYVLVRFFEAYGLWRQRRWGEWLGALSGAIYVPFELRHVLHTPSLAGVLVLLSNLAVVGFLGWQLFRERHAAPA